MWLREVKQQGESEENEEMKYNVYNNKYQIIAIITVCAVRMW